MREPPLYSRASLFLKTVLDFIFRGGHVLSAEKHGKSWIAAMSLFFSVAYNLLNPISLETLQSMHTRWSFIL